MSQLLGETLVTVKDLTKSFGDREILKSMTFTIHRDARIGILDRVVNSIVVFEDDGRVRYFDGNFETYFEVRKAEMDTQGVQTTKFGKTSYRKMVRN